MAKISVITPLHAAGNRYIQAAWETLQAQTLQDFEWIVLENHGGLLGSIEDPRISISYSELEGVGALKRRCCELASSPFIVELDNDDLLEPTALEKILKTFEEGAGVDFIYSDFAEFRDDGERGWTPAWQVEGGGGYPYSSEFGWQMYPVVFQGRALMAMRAPEATAHNIRWVDHAPNHVRAWRKEFYDLVGGHDPKLQVADDHDLVVRLFLAGARIPKNPRMPLLLSCTPGEYRLEEERGDSKGHRKGLQQDPSSHWQRSGPVTRNFAAWTSAAASTPLPVMSCWIK